jgi:hypothetical protein
MIAISGVIRCFLVFVLDEAASQEPIQVETSLMLNPWQIDVMSLHQNEIPSCSGFRCFDRLLVFGSKV